MTSFADVVESWRSADVGAIHPLRDADEDAYWQSGWHQAREAAVHIQPNGTVVDFGCGDGRVALPLVHMGFRVYALDASAAMLTRLAAEADKQTKDFSRDDLVIMESDGSGLHLSLKRTVDAVVCRAVLIHHGFKDGAELVAQLASVLKPGGSLVIDWPTGSRHERRDWIDVTVWPRSERDRVATSCDLRLVEERTDGLTVWKRLT